MTSTWTDVDKAAERALDLHLPASSPKTVMGGRVVQTLLAEAEQTQKTLVLQKTNGATQDEYDMTRSHLTYLNRQLESWGVAHADMKEVDQVEAVLGEVACVNGFGEHAHESAEPEPKKALQKVHRLADMPQWLEVTKEDRYFLTAMLEDAEIDPWVFPKPKISGSINFMGQTCELEWRHGGNGQYYAQYTIPTKKPKKPKRTREEVDLFIWSWGMAIVVVGMILFMGLFW